MKRTFGIAICILALSMLINRGAQSANVSLSQASNNTVSAVVWPDADEVAKVVDIWIAATLNGAVYFRDGANWVAYGGGVFPVAIRQVALSAITTVNVIFGLDISGLPGLSLYVGYGANEQEMLASAKRIAKIYEVGQTPTFSAPITITTGGTYTGRWESLNPAIPAVDILTTDPVVINNCVIRSKSHLIRAGLPGARLTVRNCEGYGLDPQVAGQARGNFLFGWQVDSLTAENNRMAGVNFGIQLLNLNPDHVGLPRNGPFVVRYNQARNLDGALSDGNGGRIVTNMHFGQDNGNHFAILSNIPGLQQADISWNEVILEPRVSSIGDVINIYSTNGSASSPVLVHDNFIYGGYPADLTQAARYFGGGITLDGSSSDTAATATAFVKIYNNQIIGNANFGVGISVGHDNEAYGNRVISTGLLADGTRVSTPYGNGIYVWNNPSYGQSPSVFFNNFAHDNIVGAVYEAVDASGRYVPPELRHDYYLPGCAGGQSGSSSRCTNNVSLPNPITLPLQSAEELSWIQKLKTQNIAIGTL